MRNLISAFLITLLSSCSLKTPSFIVDIVNHPAILPTKNYHYITHEPLLAQINGELVIVPRGFKTDLASIPRLIWPLLAPQYGPFVYPAILHDYLYSCPGIKSRTYVDRILYIALRNEGISRFTAFNMWFAVKIFGARHFNKGNCHG